MVPEEIRKKAQWSHSFSTEELKRPAHYDYKPDGALDYDMAKAMADAKNLLTGFYVTREDKYVLGDIDHVKDPENPWEQIPLELTMLLRSSPTYCEVSPSGEGIRFIYKLRGNAATDDGNGSKAATTGSYYLLKKDIEGGFNPKEYQINFDKPWMTITGNKLPWSDDKVGTVTLEELETVFAVRRKEKKEKDVRVQQAAPANLPTSSYMWSALRSIPLDSNPRVQRAYREVFNEEYQHYTFWMKMLMSMHDFSQQVGKDIECLNVVIEWSRADVTAYSSDEDIIKHWNSLNDKEGNVSYRSILKMASLYQLKWPMPKNQTKAEVEKGVPRKPLITEYVNFKAMVTYYAIRLYRDEDNTNLLYVSGDEDIIEQYFMMHQVRSLFGKYYGPFSKDTLTPALYILSQDIGFTGMSHSQMTQFIRTYLAETLDTINIVRLYFDTPFKDLPPDYRENAATYNKSTVDYLFEAIELDYLTEHERGKECEMYKAYYRIWLMGLVRNLYFRDSPYSNNCILLFTGPEQIRKTSHFMYLLPSFFRQEYIALTTHGFATESSMRDVVKLAAHNMVIVWDEIEQYLNAETESNFKKIIDGNPQKIIDKYEVLEKTVHPRAVYGGTSNLSEFKLGAEGSRRIFHIPVKYIDTDHMNTVCWHKLVNDLKQQMELGIRSGDIPWLLTQDQLNYQSKLHSNIRARNTLDYALEEIFDFSKPLRLIDGGALGKVTSVQNDKSGRLRTTKEVSDVLGRYGFGQLGFKRPALVKTLHRLCGDYTGTRKNSIYLSAPKCTIKKGMAKQHQFSKWVMPPIKPDMKHLFNSVH